MVALPPATPVTIPVPVPTEAIALLLLLQLPKPEASARFVVRPVHTVPVPVMATGDGFTVTTVVVRQPVASV